MRSALRSAGFARAAHDGDAAEEAGVADGDGK
jgi:hypothetical protein